MDIAVGAAQLQRDQVLIAQGSAGLTGEGEPGLAGMRQAREQVADIGPLHAEFSVTDFLTVEQHLDRGGRRRTHRPALESDLAGCRQRDLVAMMVKIVAGFRRAGS